MGDVKKVAAPAIGFALGGPAGAALGAAGSFAMDALTPKMPQMPAMPEPPKQSDADVQAAAEAERKRQRLARGRASTILTGPQGVLDEPGLARRTLL